MTGDPRIPCGGKARPESDACAPADKAALRKHLRARRAAIDPAQKAHWDGLIGARVLAWWRAQAPGRFASMAVYWPLPGEPDLSAAYAELAGLGVRLALPVVLARDTALGFAQWQPGEPMLRDAMGVAVPAALRMCERPPVLLLPCLGFNRGHYRLGYGGGYYDRTLAQPPRPVALGVAYACLQAPFASAPHDVALDLVLTEGG